jgi:hypothetical protein
MASDDDAFVNSAAASLAPQQLFADAASKYGRGDKGLFAKILAGQFAVESGNGQNQQHVDPVTGQPSGAAGPMGLMPAVQRKYGVKDPADMSQAVNAAAQYLAEGYDRTGTMEGALKYYHGGPNEKLWGHYTNAYPNQVASAAGVQAPELRSAAADPDDDFVNGAAKVMAPGAVEAPAVSGTPHAQPAAPAAPDPASAWGPVLEGSNAVLLGAGVPEAAAIHSLREGIPYKQALSELYQARGAWEAQNPASAFGLNVAGGAVLPMGAMGAVGRGAAGLADAGPGVVRNVARFLGGNAGQDAVGWSGLATRIASSAASGALQGAGYGGAAAGLYDHPLLEQVEQGAAGGALINPVISAIGGHLLAPSAAPVDPAMAALAGRVQRLGLDLRGGQLTTDPAISGLDSKFLAPKQNLDQLHSFTSAVGSRVGAGSPALTDDSLAAAVTGAKSRLDAIGARTQLNFDHQGFSDLADLRAAAETARFLPDGSKRQLGQLFDKLGIPEGSHLLTQEQPLTAPVAKQSSLFAPTAPQGPRQPEPVWQPTPAQGTPGPWGQPGQAQGQLFGPDLRPQQGELFGPPEKAAAAPAAQKDLFDYGVASPGQTNLFHGLPLQQTPAATQYIPKALSGEDYAALTSSKGILGALQRDSDPQTRQFASELRDTLDSIRDRTDPSVGPEWSAARQGWRDLLATQDWMRRSGNPETGIGDPAKLAASAAKYKASPELQDLGSAGQLKLFPRPTPEGGVKPAPGHSGSSVLAHVSPATGILGGMAATELLGEPIMHLAINHPYIAAAAGALGATKPFTDRLMAHMMAQPSYTSRLLAGTKPAMFMNPLIPFLPRADESRPNQ